jgi:hypothetical protein
MNLQLSRHGIIRLTGLAFIVSILGLAQAQVTTHTQFSSTPSDHGVTFTANVSDSAGNAATDGIVTFENAQGASLGSAFVKDGEATLTLDQQLSGQVYAIYSGSSGFRTSTAHAQVTSDAASSLPDFSITASPTSLNLSPGQYGTIVLTITPINGFNNMVTLSCSSPPPASACIFSPTTVTPVTGNPVTSSLQITTQGSSGATLVWPGRQRTAYAIVLPGLLALAGLGALRKRSGLNALSVVGLAALLAGSALGLSACSQRYDYLNHPPVANPGIAAGSYTITVAAYSNNGAAVNSHTLNIALTVQ